MNLIQATSKRVSPDYQIISDHVALDDSAYGVSIPKREVAAEVVPETGASLRVSNQV
jgi:hypothetical protein